MPFDPAIKSDRDALLSALREAGATVLAPNKIRCPFHEDKNPSSGVYQRPDGTWAFKCMAAACGVNYDIYDVRKAAGITTDLPVSVASEPAKKQIRRFDSVDELVASFSGVAARHLYSNPETGAPEMLVLRVENGEGKRFVQCSPETGGSGWKLCAPPKPWPLYNRARAIRAATVVVVEGEKCVHALADTGFVAVTSPGGANNAKHADWKPIAGKKVTLWPDFDESGAAYMRDVAAILTGLGCEISLIDPKTLDLPAHGDAADVVTGLPRPEAARKIAAILAAAQSTTKEQESDAAVSVESDWPEPRPLSDIKPAPPFPIESAFPPSLGWMRDYAVSVATSIQVPVEAVAMTMLPCLGLACARKWEILTADGNCEQPAIWTMTIQPPGSRKTAVLKAVGMPVFRWQKDRIADHKAQAAEAKFKADVAKSRVESLKRQAAQGGDAGLRAEADGIAAAREAEGGDLGSPVVVTSNTTTEALEKLLAESQERGLVLSDEGDSLDNIMGHYSEGRANMSVWLAAHAGSPYTSSRKGTGHITMLSPCLNVGLLVQNAAAATIYGSEVAKNRGLTARFLTCIPESMVGYRSAGQRGVNTLAANLWERTVRGLLDTPIDSERGPLCVTMSPDADDAWRGYHDGVEKAMRPRGVLEDHAEWGAKLAGAIARIALVLHLADDGRGGQVGLATMEAAMEWGRWLTRNQIELVERLGGNPTLRAAEEFLRVLKKKRIARFFHREIPKMLPSVRKVVAVDGVGLLEDYGYVRLSNEDWGADFRPQGGRPPMVYFVNPRFYSKNEGGG